jgi:hypothetical protein
MKRITLLTTSIFTFLLSHAGKVSGSVTDTKGNSLAFASIIVKGSTRGVVANSQGRYAINLEPGTYNIVCQFVGYKAEEKKITVTAEDMTVNFQLSVQELKMDEVVIKRGEDPAMRS